MAIAVSNGFRVFETRLAPPLSRDEWLERRARFNHDWLQVSFLTFLQAWHVELDVYGSTADLPVDIRTVLGEWVVRRPVLDLLIRYAEQLLGPGKVLDEFPLNELPYDQRLWLLDEVGKLWREASGFRLLIGDLEATATSVDEVIGNLLADHPCLHAGTRLYAKCQTVSRLLTALPMIRGA